MRIVVLNGVNLDVLGRRDPETYGGLTLSELETRIYDWASELGTVRCRQTNHEGSSWTGATTPSTGRTASSGTRARGRTTRGRSGTPSSSSPCRSSRCHLSDVDSREEWRRFSVLEGLAAARFVGRGPDGYRDALEFLVKGGR